MDDMATSSAVTEGRARQAQWRAVTDLFGRCHGLPVEQRNALLENAAPDIAAEVQSLLDFATQQNELLLSPAEQILQSPRSIPTQIGPYLIERPLGEGGMGLVYLARRAEDFDQLVAIKLIRRGVAMDLDAMQERFRRERQILASLRHPCIAHLIDGGVFEGQPYLVVEFVDGVRIDHYCLENRLTVE